MEFNTSSNRTRRVPLSAYANLLKASWILTDIIACHPQLTFVNATTCSEVMSLSAEIKNEHLALSATNLELPNLGELEHHDYQIWETMNKGSFLRPSKKPGNPDEWTVKTGERVLFQRTALYKPQAGPEVVPCILFFLVQKAMRQARLVAQNQIGATVMSLNRV